MKSGIKAKLGQLRCTFIFYTSNNNNSFTIKRLGLPWICSSRGTPWWCTVCRTRRGTSKWWNSSCKKDRGPASGPACCSARAQWGCQLPRWWPTPVRLSATLVGCFCALRILLAAWPQCTCTHTHTLNNKL